MAGSPPSARTPRAVRLTDRDQELLSFAAEHRLVLTSHAEVLLDTSERAASARLLALARGGYVSYHRVFTDQPACCVIRRKGLAAIDSTLPPPRLDLACYKHDVGAAWLWLAARSGTFGPIAEVLGERRLRSVDGAADQRPEPYGVRLGGLGPHGRERLHYPDLLVITPARGRIALELELSAKGRARRDTILAGYASDSRVEAVMYLVEDRAAGQSIGRSIEASARRMGISSLVHVGRVRWSTPMPGDQWRHTPGRTAARRLRALAKPSAEELTR